MLCLWLIFGEAVLAESRAMTLARGSWDHVPSGYD